MNAKKKKSSKLECTDDIYKLTKSRMQYFSINTRINIFAEDAYDNIFVVATAACSAFY
jgi:ABC-type oligopeptide transport system substrate-binding subunit